MSAGLPVPVFDRDGVRLYHGDSLAILPTLEFKDDVAVVSDPPYGMDWDTDSTRYSGGQSSKIVRRKQQNMGQEPGRYDWGAILGDDRHFDPKPWLRFPKVILWGSNHYVSSLPVGTTLVWIKRSDDLFGSFLSDAEIGWMKGGYGVYCFRKQFPPPVRMKEGGGTVLHPNQKPIALMRWCIERLKLQKGSIIFDPYMGSGTTGVAALQLGFRFVGIEQDPCHFATAARRLAEPPMPLFDLADAADAARLVQAGLFDAIGPEPAS